MHFPQLQGKWQGKTRKDGARPALFLIFVCPMYFLCCSMYFCVILCIVGFVSLSVLFLCVCVLYCCHRVATQLQLNISYHAFGTQVRGFKPDRSRRIFKGEKIFSTSSFGGGVKPSVPCRRFAACKRSLELSGSRILRRNLSEHFSPTKSSTFRC